MNIKTRKVAHVPNKLYKFLSIAVTTGISGRELGDFLTKWSAVTGENKIYDEVYARKLMQRFRDMVGIKKT